MKTLDSCFVCGGFFPTAAAHCPHCQAKIIALQPRRGFSPALARATKIALGTLGGGATAITLMACYGPPCTTTTTDGHTRCVDYYADDAHSAADAQIGDSDAGIHDGSVQDAHDKDARDRDAGDAAESNVANDAASDTK